MNRIVAKGAGTHLYRLNAMSSAAVSVEGSRAKVASATGGTADVELAAEDGHKVRLWMRVDGDAEVRALSREQPEREARRVSLLREALPFLLGAVAGLVLGFLAGMT